MKSILTLMLILSSNPIFAQGWQWLNPLPQGNTLRDMYFVDASTGWLVGSGGMILHTKDGGETWEIQENPTRAWFETVFFVDAKNGWAGGDGFDGDALIVHTVDGGQTWAHQSIDIVNVPRINDIYFLDSQTGWAVGDFGSVLHTTDGGTNWTQQSVPVYYRDLESVFFIDPNKGWAVGDDFYTTTDGGRNWALDTTDTFGPYSGQEILFTNPMDGWQLMMGNKVFRTHDGGLNWAMKDEGLTGDLSDLSAVNADTAWVAGDDGLFQTTDSGETWANKLSSNYVGKELVFFPDGRHGWAVLDRHKIYRSADGGEQWENLTKSVSEVEFWSVDFVDEQTGWLAGSGGIILHSQDGGVTWQQQMIDTDARLNHVCFLDELTGWVVGWNGLIAKTLDGGLNWSIHSQDRGGRSPHWASYFIDPLTGWVVGGDVGEQGWILHTGDGGLNWVEQTPGVVAPVRDIVFVNREVGWTVSRDGNIYHTKDGGLNWNEQTSNTDKFLRTIVFFDENFGYVLPESEYILRTTDGGQQWQKINVGGFRGGIWDMSFANIRHGWIAGGLGEVFATSDSGQTWILQNSGTSQWLRSIDFVSKHKGWVVGVNHIIMCTETGGNATGIKIPENGNNVPAVFKLFQNYP
ncbi:MAG: WD40/YVTN/BNR-like repeat-containing protein, partial [bacterium]